MKMNMNNKELKNFLLHAPQESIVKYMENIHPVDILDVLRENPEDSLDILNRLSEKTIADIIDEAEDKEKYEILIRFGDNKQKNIVEEMSSDELADLLGILDEEESNKLLSKMTIDEARNVRQLLSYASDTAAGIMATEFISIKDNMTVKETLKYLQQAKDDNENIYDLYVIDNFDRLKGSISLKDIVTNDFDTKISNIINTEISPIPFDMDQEEVGNKFAKYGFLSMPVVDNSNRLLGIITVDDAMQIIRDEGTEDINRLGGVADEEKINGTLRESVKYRLPWLLINLLTAIFASATVGLFEGTIEQVVSLATFMSIVSGMGGNAGTQTLTIIVRGLALGELNSENAKRVLLKEFFIGAITGAAVGAVIAILGFFWERNIAFGIIIGVAMILNMIVATVTGFIIPVLLKKLKVDPALASSIFVTTFTDVLGFFFFLGLATLFIQYLV
jgi:magnesium transporter